MARKFRDRESFQVALTDWTIGDRLTDLTCPTRDPNCCKVSLYGGLGEDGQGGEGVHGGINMGDSEVFNICGREFPSYRGKN